MSQIRKSRRHLCGCKSITLLLLVLNSFHLWAGGVLYVGGSAFDPSARGKPVTWLNGQITYFTDQGILSPLLDQNGANNFVADAFSRWTSVSTTALAATRSGSLAEDVNGSNISTNGALPSDIQPTAIGKPLAIVFDNDGQVIDALMGGGASDPALCATNSVLGGIDNLNSAGNFSHALVIINGRCAQTSTSLIALKYRLIRKFGEILGLGWSQVNDNVRTNTPPPTDDDFAGFPVMHPVDLLCLIPSSVNCANAGNLRMDDRAAISRLYPVTPENLSQFPGKQTFLDHAIRIRGSVYFSNVHGGQGQPMQGVNVVARLIDPVTGLPSGRSVASSVSGFLFRGDAGNEISGFVAADGRRLDAFGSANASQQGFYDLAGLELAPNNANARYQLSLEAVNSLYTGESTVGPYRVGPVTPSGGLSSVTFNLDGLNAGSDVVRNFILTNSAKISADAFEPNPFASPASIPASGEWWGSLSPYGDSDFFHLSTRANRTLVFEVTALNEIFQPSFSKAQPMLGLWLAADQAGSAPRVTQGSFNTASVGVTRLAANIFQDTEIKLGIADVRGDGRPDFLYHARLFYADHLTPSRVTAAGMPIVIYGIGFRPGVTVTMGGVNAAIMHTAEDQIIAAAASLPDGSKTVVVTDPITGATSTMTDALQYGPAVGSQLVLVSGSNPSIPVGADAPNAIRVRVVAADGLTGVPATPVAFSVSSASILSPCSTGNCSIQTDDTGEAATVVSVKFAGINTISATLSDGQIVQATVLGTSFGLTLTAMNPLRFFPSGNSASLALTVRALNNGIPAAGQHVNYLLTSGSGVLSTASSTTDASGNATVNLNIGNVTGSTTVVACLATGTCPQFSIQAVAPSNLQLRMIAGGAQILMAGQPSQPVVLRVTDSAVPSNYVCGVPVTITQIVTPNSALSTCIASQGTCRPVDLKILFRSSTTLISDANGLISFVPAMLSSWRSVRMSIGAATGSAATQNTSIRVYEP